MADYKILLDKINEFKQKFYLNKLLRGLIYTATATLALYLFLFLYVYFAHPAVATKTLLFSFFIAAFLFAFIYWLLMPGLAYFRLGRSISTEEAANFIGDHFSSVKDKLLNTLQLQSLVALSPENSMLILAGIDQKITELRPVPFASAISLKENRKYIKFFLIPLGIILLIGLIAPAILKEGSYSFIKFNKEILPVAPFDFVLENKSLTVTQGDDLKLLVNLKGDQFPQDVYLEDGQNSYKLEKKNISTFTHTLKNLQRSVQIRFSGGGFSSVTHTVDVKPRPSVLNINATLRFPAYLGKKAEEINNAGDLLIPEGTKVTWKLNSENSSSLNFLLGNASRLLNAEGNVSVFSAVIRDNIGYKVIAQNHFVSNNDSLAHQISVIKDQYPTIAVQEMPDSLSTKVRYFSGNIADDHGFSGLFFCYNVLEEGKAVRSYRKAVDIKNNQAENAYFYTWDLNTAQIKQGEIVEYYFEVADNDGVNGPKKTKSAVATLQAPTQQQIASKINSDSQQLKEKMEKAIKLAGTVEKESKKLNESILDKKQLSYEDKKQVEQLLDKQKQLEDAVKEINELNNKNNISKEENTQLKEELLQKQKQINDLFNNVLDAKTKDLLKMFEKLVQENNKDQAQDQLSKMQMDNKSLKNELDRILELYKQLEFEQMLQNAIDRLHDLSKKQQGLSVETKNKQSANETLKEKQNGLSNDFKDLKETFQELETKDKALERPNGFKSPEKESSEIQQLQQESGKNIDEKENNKSTENQQDAAKKMEELARKMEEMQQSNEEKETEINIDELRKLLENLLNTSFEQEKTMLSLRRMAPSDPLYVTNVQKQRSIKDNMSTIADSLYALSKRVPQIETTVNEEMQKINFNIEKSLDNLGERRTADANKFQQFTLTSVNNLALMLNEALEQLQQQQKNGKGGGKSKKKGMKQLQEMQDQLNKNMEKAKQQLQQTGNKGTVPKQMSEQFAKMAQQQQMIREALQEINRDENKDGKGPLGNLNQVIKDMKQTEQDLVNKKIEQETINRQKGVLTKLLDADNAQRQQDQDAKREAKEAKAYPPSYKQMLEKFNKLQQNETELLQKLSPDLNYYYKNKIAEYFRLLNAGK